MNDIFTARFIFPDKVSIIAPGPNAVRYVKKLDGFRIAVNRAVLMPTYQSHMWIVADKTGLQKDWWIKTWNYPGIRCFSDKLQNELYKHDYLDWRVDYTFAYERLGKHDTPVPKQSYTPMPKRFQGDGTTSGIAIEMAARFGAKTIELCGVDFEGDTHWDGVKAPCTITDRAQGWDVFLPYMNSLIEWVQGQGIDIYSVSKTKLNIGVK